MSELRDFYSKIGHNPEQIENTCWYLSELSLRAAIEVDNHILGRNNDFSHVNELADILKKYEIPGKSLITYNFPYIPLWKALKKEIRMVSELGLEMKLLRTDLEQVATSPKPEALRKFLCDFSVACRNDEYALDSYKRLVA